VSRSSNTTNAARDRRTRMKAALLLMDGVLFGGRIYGSLVFNFAVPPTAIAGDKRK
jgi:hypothetical protein